MKTGRGSCHVSEIVLMVWVCRREKPLETGSQQDPEDWVDCLYRTRDAVDWFIGATKDTTLNVAGTTGCRCCFVCRCSGCCCYFCLWCAVVVLLLLFMLLLLSSPSFFFVLLLLACKAFYSTFSLNISTLINKITNGLDL